MRTFVAVDVTGTALKAVAEFQSGFTARPVSSQNLHFTLMFLGKVAKPQLPQVQDALRSVSFDAFEVELAGAGAFPNAHRPRVIWVGSSGSGGRKLASLAEDVRGRLSPLGFDAGGPFRPHVTVLRAGSETGDVGGHLNRYRDVVFGTCIVSTVRLKRSELTPNGPIYSDLCVVEAEA